MGSGAGDGTEKAMTAIVSALPLDANCSHMAKRQAPQETVNQFWNRFTTNYPGKVLTVLPSKPFVRNKAAAQPQSVTKGYGTAKSYEQVRKECELVVKRIVRECERVNQKYTDPHFDIEVDLKGGSRDCLDGLLRGASDLRPKGVKRVSDVFEKPKFFLDGPTAGDVRQGRDGDCWFMAALCTMGNKKGLIDRICVAHDEKVGVYGFVFYRDGEWQHCIVDDKLYLRVPDYDESIEERSMWDDIIRADTEEEYRKVWQTGSRALYFAQCSDENETWLPLLEKAYAKAHGDYSAIEGGFVGEAIEDLTGGVTTELMSSSVLDKEKFWQELMSVNDEFLFGCWTGIYSDWLHPLKGEYREQKGIVQNHAYSIMDAKEIDGVRLLRLRNPWGEKEWEGPWSDGSEQWTSKWMERLDHKFGNDGVFWISYEDLLKKYQFFDRTRLFDPDWTITQQWTSLEVPWSTDYHSTKFVMELTKEGPVVIVLSQLDTRYFRGLEGEYHFSLQFRLEKEGEEEYIVRSRNGYSMTRSVNSEITLEPGRYTILVKVTARRCGCQGPPEEVIKKNAPNRREKLIQIGLLYDLAHAKAVVTETEEEKNARKEREKCKQKAEREKLRQKVIKKRQKDWIKMKKEAARQRRVDAAMQPSPQPEVDVATAQSSSSGEGDGEESEVDSPSTEGPESSEEEEKTVSSEGKTTKAEAANTPPSPTLGKNQNLLDGFEFDSDLDMPSEDDDDDDDYMPPLDGDEDDEETGDDEGTPWNAVCVIGLKVYSQDPQLCLRVVKPSEEDPEVALDLDHPAASAAQEKGSP
ncbi:hypothetical protein Egran_03665 [Elaphomyces granulatus]|uniref:Calpain catalytic domain-containing protein n=1 Tax=Elaphomyces granulatus TaxID=519963 RepID=A0A232LWS9_9EURO|nr:hypothetical protein Egran_03665 [Elaphomyces granulatus]